MEELTKHEEPTRGIFSYEAISEKARNDKEKSGYRTVFSNDGFFATLFGPEDFTNPYAWKMHISLLENEENIKIAWEVIVNILIRYGIQESKVIRKGNRFQEYQKGKEITIYFQEGDTDWVRMFTEIEDALLEKGVVPNYKAIGDKQVDGSQFLACRQGEFLLGIQSDTHNPSGIPHVFETLSVRPRFPKVVKIVRKNEERVRTFYVQLEKNYFEVLNEFRVNFPYIINKKNIFSRIDENCIEENFQKYPADVAQRISLGIKEIIFIGKEIEVMRQEKENLIEAMDEERYTLCLEKMLEKFKRINELVSRVLGILNENSSESDPSSGCFVIKEVHAPSKGSPRFVIEYSSVEVSPTHSEDDSSKAEESPKTSEEAAEEIQPKRPGFRK